MKRVFVIFLQPVLRRTRRGKGRLGSGGGALEVARRACLTKSDGRPNEKEVSILHQAVA
jgi:hypothetical protein